MFESSGSQTLAAIDEYERANKVPSLARSGFTTYPALPFRTRSDPPSETGGMAAARALFQLDPEATVFFTALDEQTGHAAGKGVEIAARQLGVGDRIEYIYINPAAPSLEPIAQQIGVGDDHTWVITGQLDSIVLNLLKALKEVVGYKGNVVLIGNVPTAQWGGNADGVYTILQVYPNCVVDETTPACVQMKKFSEDHNIPWNARYSVAIGAQQVEILVRALEIAGPDLTREGLMEAMWVAMDGRWACAFCTEDSPYIVTPNDDAAREFIVRLWRWDADTATLERVEGVDPIFNTETSFGLGLIGSSDDYACQPPSADRPLGTCPWKGTEWDKSGQ